jgi:hypothetical protein
MPIPGLFDAAVFLASFPVGLALRAIAQTVWLQWATLHADHCTSMAEFLPGHTDRSNYHPAVTAAADRIVAWRRRRTAVGN